jgi:diguanylate cyclase (GGDEF)-like protein
VAASDPSGSALFVIAPNGGQSLPSAVQEAGWRPVTGQRGEDSAGAFAASGATVSLIDARVQLDAGLAALRALADAAEINAAALMILIADADRGALADIFAAGATHYLAEPFNDAELVQALRLAERHAERAGSGKGGAAWQGGDRRAGAPEGGTAPTPGRDPVTGLGNALAVRRWIDARANAGRTIHILMIGITRFEVVNSAFGRDTGDDVLRGVARTIHPLATELGGRHTLVARAAGAEFMIGLDGAYEPERLRLLAQQLIDQVERPIHSGAHLVSLKAQIAIVMAQGEEIESSSLLRRATAALTDPQSPEAGQVRFASPAADLAGSLETMLRADLAGALGRDEIDMVFQPQVAIASGAIVGVEALARWAHPKLGVLGAATLFASAEQAKMLDALSAHIQRRALTIAAAWPETLCKLRLAINITAQDIAIPGFATEFLKLVDESGFPRGRLTVEIVENGLIEDLGAAAALLSELRAGGCRVAIDDFGTGYSSLAYLKSLPLDYLKIDKQLAGDICGAPRDRIVVRGVIDMARSLGLAVIAEGVETEEQLGLLAREGCNYYQGFLFSEPVESTVLAELVERTRP